MSGGVAEEGWGYGLGEERQQGSGQVSEERTLVGLTRAPPSLREISHQAAVVVYRRRRRVLRRSTTRARVVVRRHRRHATTTAASCAREVTDKWRAAAHSRCSLLRVDRRSLELARFLAQFEPIASRIIPRLPENARNRSSITDSRCEPPLLSPSVLHFNLRVVRAVKHRRKAGRRVYRGTGFFSFSFSLSLSLSISLFPTELFTVHPGRVVTRQFGRAPSDPQQRAPARARQSRRCWRESKCAQRFLGPTCAALSLLPFSPSSVQSFNHLCARYARTARQRAASRRHQRGEGETESFRGSGGRS